MRASLESALRLAWPCVEKHRSAPLGSVLDRIVDDDKGPPGADGPKMLKKVTRSIHAPAQPTPRRAEEQFITSVSSVAIRGSRPRSRERKGAPPPGEDSSAPNRPSCAAEDSTRRRHGSALDCPATIKKAGSAKESARGEDLVDVGASVASSPITGGEPANTSISGRAGDQLPSTTDAPSTLCISRRGAAEMNQPVMENAMIRLVHSRHPLALIQSPFPLASR
jgi:hypothetical protein